MMSRMHSKAYLEALFHPPQSSGTIGSRPSTMPRTTSIKGIQGATDNYKPTRSSILAPKESLDEGEQDASALGPAETEASEQDNEDGMVADPAKEDNEIALDRDSDKASVVEPPSTPNKALSATSTDDEVDDPSRHLRISTLQQAARRISDGASNASHASQSIQAIFAVLENGDIDDEERIEQVRSLLGIKLREVEGNEVPAARLDSIVLSLLHRHREDQRPTGATFPMPTSPSPSPFPASPRSRPRPANLRVGSSATVARPWTPSRPVTPTNANKLASDVNESLPASPLPASSLNGGGGGGGSMSTLTGSPRASPRLWHRTISSNTINTPTGPSISTPTSINNLTRPIFPSNGSRPSSPAPGVFGSPALNVSAMEFKPRAVAGTPAPLTPVQTPAEPWLTDMHDAPNRGGHAAASTDGDDSDEDEFSPFAGQGTGAVPVPSSSSSSTSSSRLNASRTRPVSGTSGNSSFMSMTTADSVSGGSYHGSTTSTSLESFEDPRSLRSTGLEDDFDNLTMTPFDVLTSILNGIGSGPSSSNLSWSPEQMEEALERNGWDVDATLTAIMEGLVVQPAGIPPSPMTGHRAVPTGPAASRSGVSVVSHEVFASQRAGLTGSPGPSEGTASRHPFVRTTSTGVSSLSPSISPATVQQQQASRASGPGRVCRFFLAGECRRADCRFSHDLNRALCRFWLKGQCLNGDDCSFLHDLSVVDSVANRAPSAAASPAFAPFEPETPPAEEFPELNLAPTAPKAQRGKTNITVDPSRARWSQALQRKWNSPMSQIQLGESHVALSAKHGPIRGAPTGPRASHSPVPTAAVAAKQRNTIASRIPLRPPLLLPTLHTGRSASQAYATYREACAALSDKRNKCLARAAEAWKAGNGAEARKWSHEGQSINRILQDESRALARTILRGRHDEIRQRIMANNDGAYGAVDAALDEKGARGLRGKSMGADLGVCLGVVPQRAPTTSAGNLASLSMDERTDVLMDCHLLHASECVEMIEEFLMGLEREQFRGLAYLAVGLGKHTSTETDRRRVGLAPAIKSFLGAWGYPHNDVDGVLVVDPLTHL